MANVEKVTDDIKNLNMGDEINNNNIEDVVNEQKQSELQKTKPEAENKIVVEQSENNEAILETDEVDGADRNEDNKDTTHLNSNGVNLVLDGLQSEPKTELKEPVEVTQEAPAAQVPRSSPFAVRSLIDCPEYYTAFDGSYPTAF